MTTYRQCSWFSCKEFTRVLIDENVVVRVELKQSFYCNSGNITIKVVVTLRVIWCNQIVKYVSQLVVDFGQLGPACYCDRLRVPRNGFAFRPEYATNGTVNKCCTDMDGDNKMQSYAKPDSCLLIARAWLQQDQLF